MNFEEHRAKSLLAEMGIETPRGALAESAARAADIARALGPVVVKAQVPAGKRGRAGGIVRAADPGAAAAAAERILGMEIAGHRVERVLVEEQVDIAHEHYAAVTSDAASKGPLVLFSAAGGMDIEEVAIATPGALRRAPVDIRKGFTKGDAARLLEGDALAPATEAVADALAKLYAAYRRFDAELIEVNPLAATRDGRLVAVDGKLVLDDAAIERQAELARKGVPEPLTRLEAAARAAGLKYVELDGDIGVLANGAGLTMATMDVVRRLGGTPANFLEIGGDAYARAAPALRLVLENRRVRSLVVNFCGAFARTDVMVAGVAEAWRELAPALPVFFCVHGTGEEAARERLRSDLGVEPYETMDAAIAAAVAAARAGG
jgi:succinyl-CoA synthetase beta subunit